MLQNVFKADLLNRPPAENNLPTLVPLKPTGSAVQPPPDSDRALSDNNVTPAWGIFSQKNAPAWVEPPEPVQPEAPKPSDVPSLGAGLNRSKKTVQPNLEKPSDTAGFGAFSGRRAKTKVPSTRHDRTGSEQSAWSKVTSARRSGNETSSSKTAGTDPWGAMANAARRTGTAATSSRAASDDPFSAMVGSRRGADESKKSKNKEDFWGELEERVEDYREKIKSIPKRATPEPISATAWAIERENQGQQKQKNRKSRFEVEKDWNERQDKKSKQKNVKNRRSRNDEDWDDDEAFHYEELERKKEEKRLRKLQEEQEADAIPIFLPEFVSVTSLARSLKQGLESFRHDLEEMGFENMSNDTILTGETAALIAMEYGFEPTVDTGSTHDLKPRSVPDDVSSLPSRPPIVTIMGHVDHGKTTLLDYLRKSSVAAQEHGGITQHIGAFVVKMSSGKPITFLDTPGHAAFLTMRQRGANVTDIVVLVVAADDSVKPQTLEALKHAQTAKVPIIVAINKIDKEEARVDQVKADLSRHGVQIEDYGGDVQVVEVSGKTGQGMDDLEENIVTLSEILDVRSEHDGMAEGWVLESSVKTDGKVATVLVKRGTLRQGDFIVAGRSWARIRVLRNEAGVEVTEAPPGTPVEILGWRDLPEAGEQVLQSPDEDKAKTAVNYRQEMAERQQSSVYLAEQEQKHRDKEAAEAAAAAAEKEGTTDDTLAEPGVIIQNYTVKADVAGSVEAVCGSVQELGNNEVQSKILRYAVGQISEYDVDHAAISKSIIVNFNLPIAPHIKHRAEEAGVRIVDHSVIYHVVDDVKTSLEALLPPRITHRVIAEADVLQVFSINIKKRVFKNIAGCRIRNGSVKRNSMVKVLRKGKVVFDGKSYPPPFIPF